jgi:hypothetical protein
MRRIAGNRPLAERLGRAGQARIRQLYDPHVIGARYLDRFAAIAKDGMKNGCAPVSLLRRS